MTPFTEPLCATLLLLVVTHSRVLLAADSRRNVLYPDGTLKPGTMDKIFRTGDCYYAVAGLSSTEDGAFSLQTILHKLLLRHPRPAKALKRIATTVAAELKHYLCGLKSRSPALFAQLLRDSHSGGEIVLVKREEGIPTAWLLSYRIVDGTPVRVVLQSWSIDTTRIEGAGDCFWRAIGTTGFLNRGMPTPQDMAAHPEENIKALMQQGTGAHPRQISGPLNILELTHQGEHWIEKTPTAPAGLQ